MIKKILAVLLFAASFACLACWFPPDPWIPPDTDPLPEATYNPGSLGVYQPPPDDSSSDINTIKIKRSVYLAGVNGAVNHVSFGDNILVGYSMVDGVVTKSYYAVNMTYINNQVVDFPLTVYIGVCNIECDGTWERSGSWRTYNLYQQTPLNHGNPIENYMTGIEIKLEYRVYPSNIWITAKTVKIESVTSALLYPAKQRNLFGARVINVNPPKGTYVQIRLTGKFPSELPAWTPQGAFLSSDYLNSITTPARGGMEGASAISMQVISSGKRRP